MRADGLRLGDLLELTDPRGLLKFAGQRVVLMDVVALGLLRVSLVREFGWAAARGILTRLGYSHGWQTALSMKDSIDWDNEHEWKRAGGRLHRLQGLVEFEPVRHEDRGGTIPFADAIWRNSYEAEQHIQHFGQSEDCVCWSLCGFASGYLSAAYELNVYCVEETCVGRGDAVCRMIGKTQEEWGDAIKPHLVYYEKGCLEQNLKALRDELKKTEKMLQDRRQILGENSEDEVGGVIARSQEMKKVLEVAKRVAIVDSSVLLLGETGVGKERMARFIHDHSARASGPFVALNCGALPEGLLESELFGFVKGAFTGAEQDRAGLFEAAQGGTLFLDEIGEVSPALQLRLLRVLQERKVRRLGENRDRAVDIRLLAATHRDLKEAVKSGDFREDLYYRLRVIDLHIPPLRERIDDILPLAQVQLRRIAFRFKRSVNEFSPSVARQLLRYPWPGNVRELHNTVERAVVFAESDCIKLHDLPPEVAQGGEVLPRISFNATAPTGETLGTLADMEKAHILAMLETTDGNKAEAARRLGIGVATLFRKLKKYQQDSV